MAYLVLIAVAASLAAFCIHSIGRLPRRNGSGAPVGVPYVISSVIRVQAHQGYLDLTQMKPVMLPPGSRGHL